MALVLRHPDPEFRISISARAAASPDWQERVVRMLKERIAERFVGTSNVWLAKRCGLIPLGTMAHEYNCRRPGGRPAAARFAEIRLRHVGQGIPRRSGYRADQHLRGGRLPARLRPVLLSALFDGVRHDSGDPFEWGEKMIAHYQKMRVDPRTKSFVFSDSLNVPLCVELYDRFQGRCKPAFGLGTNLTNDLGYQALQIVIKMTRCNGQPVAEVATHREDHGLRPVLCGLPARGVRGRGAGARLTRVKWAPPLTCSNSRLI